jgi:hypothetical protein
MQGKLRREKERMTLELKNESEDDEGDGYDDG